MFGCLLLPFKIVFVVLKLAFLFLMFALALVMLPLLCLIGLAYLIRSMC
jgi:hypothetical protein